MEIVIVLLVVALVSGGAIGYLVYSRSERLLRNTAGEIEVMAKRAHTVALLQQRPYALVFTPGLVRLMPLAETALGDQEIPKAKTSKPSEYSDEEAASTQPPLHAEVVLEDGLRMSLRRWASETWIPMKEREVHIWRFDPDGLCEPVAIHLADGDNWIEDSYHPLTASVRDTSMFIK